jgi:hypothetical protein
VTLYQRLLSGRIYICDNLFITVSDSNGVFLDKIHPRDLVGGGWGFVFERVVGQHYEDLGYKVEYRGARLGYLDQGIDLVATSPKEQRYIQCKFLLHGISPQEVHQILFKSSAYLLKYAPKGSLFELVVPDISLAFPIVRNRTGREQPNMALKHFLAANKTQSQVRVTLSEIPMPVTNPHFDPGTLGC